jgi:hypothetical protein
VVLNDTRKTFVVNNRKLRFQCDSDSFFFADFDNAICDVEFESALGCVNIKLLNRKNYLKKKIVKNQ